MAARSGLRGEIRDLTRFWVRKGDKKGRQRKLSVMLEFADHAIARGSKSFGQVGRKTVISFWKAQTHLADSTLRRKHDALRDLWSLAARPDCPPGPFTQDERGARERRLSSRARCET